MPYQPELHPVPVCPEGTVELVLDSLVQLPPDTRGNAGRKLHADVVFTLMTNRARPGFFGEPELINEIPGYCSETFPEAVVLWPVRDQERFDRVVRFIPRTETARSLFARIAEALRPSGVLFEAAAAVEVPLTVTRTA